MNALPLSPALLPLLALAGTLGAYLLGVALHKRLRTALANPVLIAILVIGLTLKLFHISYATYFSGAQFIHFLLGPATVSLAIPLVQSLAHVRRSAGPLLAALAAGALAGLIGGYGLVRLCGGDQVLALSMAPKSLTTPIAIGVSQSIGGLPALTAVFAIAGGIAVAVSLDIVLGWLKIDDPAVRGLAAGTAGSGIGASRVIPQDPVAAAFAAVAIGANGFLSAVLAPLIVPLLKHW